MRLAGAGTSQEKTRETWIVSVLPVLEMLKMAQSDMEDLQEKHRLQDSASTDADVESSIAALASLPRKRKRSQKFWNFGHLPKNIKKPLGYAAQGAVGWQHQPRSRQTLERL